MHRLYAPMKVKCGNGVVSVSDPTQRTIDLIDPVLTLSPRRQSTKMHAESGSPNLITLILPGTQIFPFGQILFERFKRPIALP